MTNGIEYLLCFFLYKSAEDLYSRTIFLVITEVEDVKAAT